MKRQTLFFGIFATTILAVPAFAVGDNAGITGLHWGRNAFGYEPLPSGPQPVTNLKRRRDGTSDGAQLVGDYNNSILKPAAGEVVKQRANSPLPARAFQICQTSAGSMRRLSPLQCSSAFKCCKRAMAT